MIDFSRKYDLRLPLQVLAACLGYLVVVLADFLCLKYKVCDSSTALTVLSALGLVTFVIAVTALFKIMNQAREK
jgi:hypothetical protein